MFASNAISFDPTSSGHIVALVTGCSMVLVGIKLLWPPGTTFPFKVSSWTLLKRLETFLKDSKYGSYHVYLASLVLVLYCLHASWALSYAASPYFLFAATSYFILRMIHPATNQYISSIFGLSTFQILSIEAKPLRTRGVNSVTLTVRPPRNQPLSSYENSCCDLIMLRNKTSVRSWLLETVYYYSIVNMEVVETKDVNDPIRLLIKLFISPSRRKDGVASTLLRNGRGWSDKKDDRIVNDKIQLEMTTPIKSSVMEALYGPNIIAIGYDSGASSFLSLLRSRAQMRRGISSMVSRNSSDFVDLCVIWLPFKHTSSQNVDAAEIETALKDLSQLQEYLVRNGGGESAKFIFIASGVPPEWTPSPECIAHKTR